MSLAGSFTPIPSSQLLTFVQSRSGQKVTKCYQCGKCTASCPVAYEMDLVPRQIMRGIQLGLREEVLNSSTIWLCVHCMTCSVRCPLEIEVAKVMESLRVLTAEERRYRHFSQGLPGGYPPFGAHS